VYYFGIPAKLAEIHIKGIKQLDKTGMDAIKLSGPLPPLPDDFPLHQLRIRAGFEVTER